MRCHVNQYLTVFHYWIYTKFHRINDIFKKSCHSAPLPFHNTPLHICYTPTVTHHFTPTIYRNSNSFSIRFACGWLIVRVTRGYPLTPTWTEIWPLADQFTAATAPAARTLHTFQLHWRPCRESRPDDGSHADISDFQLRHTMDVHTDSNNINYNYPLHFDYGKVHLPKVLKWRDTVHRKMKNTKKTLT